MLCAVLLATPAAAQQRIDRFAAPGPHPVATIALPDSVHERPALLLGAGGVLAGAALGAVGGLIGYAAGCGSDAVTNPGMPEEDYCGLLALPGFVAGEVIGIPLGVWLANDLRGSFGADLLASLGAFIVGSGAALLAGEAHARVVVPLIPLAQIFVVVATERATADDD